MLDAAVATLLLVLDALGASSLAPPDQRAGYLRRRSRWPRPWRCAGARRAQRPRSCSGAALAVLTQPALAVNHFALMAVAVMVGTVRVHCGGRDAQVLLGGIVAGAALWTWATGSWGPWLWLIWVAVAAVVGEVVAAAGARRTELDRDRELAAAQERARIAREMHDVVTHAVSVMVVHAEGARLVLRRDPEGAERAMGTTADAGRQTPDELRGLVAALRGTDGDPDGGPDGDLVGLAAMMRAAGLAVRLDPERPQLPAGLRATGYRIVQEALTNCLRHAPPGAAVTVLVEVDGRELRIEVADDGGADRKPASGPGRVGAGVVGMRERARAAGGELEAGPRRSGGWRVLAVLPLPRTQ